MLPGLDSRVSMNSDILAGIDTTAGENAILIDLNGMSLGMIKDKADTIEPITAMNSDDLAKHAVDVTGNTGKVGDNTAALSGISPKADDNATKVG